MDGKKIMLWAAIALAALLALVFLRKSAKPSGIDPGSAVASITTLAELEQFYQKINADYQSGAISYEQYLALYDAYQRRYYELV